MSLSSPNCSRLRGLSKWSTACSRTGVSAMTAHRSRLETARNFNAFIGRKSRDEVFGCPSKLQVYKDAQVLSKILTMVNSKAPF